MAPVPERIRWTVDLLDVGPQDQVLEIGCGAGHAVALVAERLRRGGMITAIDRSEAMVARARAVNAAGIAAGRVRIVRQAMEEAAVKRSMFAKAFAKAFAINVNAFWTEPAPSVAALGRLVSPGGMVCLAYEPPAASRLRALEVALPAALEEGGFRSVNVHVHPSPQRPLLAVLARGPA